MSVERDCAKFGCAQNATLTFNGVKSSIVAKNDERAPQLEILFRTKSKQIVTFSLRRKIENTEETSHLLILVFQPQTKSRK